MKISLGFLAAALAAGPASAADGPSMVPADALGFVHVSARKVWLSDTMADARKAVMMADKDVLASLDRRFTPAPSTFNTLTVFVAGSVDQPLPVGVLTFTEPFDRAKFLASFRPPQRPGRPARGLTPRKAVNRAGVTLYSLGEIAFAFPDAKTIVVGPEPAVMRFNPQPGRSGPLAKALRAAATNDVTVALNMRSMPPQMLNEVPPPVRPMLNGNAAVVTLNLRDDAELQLRAEYADAAAVAKAERTLLGLAQVARAELKKLKPQAEQMVLGDGKPAPLEKLPEALLGVLSVGGLTYLDGILADPPVKREGTALAVAVNVPKEVFAYFATAGIVSAYFGFAAESAAPIPFKGDKKFDRKEAVPFREKK